MSFIPGMSGVFGSSGQRSPLATIEVVGVNYSEDSDSVAYPPDLDLQEGDVAILIDYCTREGSGVTTVVPSGYTELANNTSNTFENAPGDTGRARHIISYRFLDGTETGTLLGMIHNRFEEKFLMIVRGNVPIGDIQLQDFSFLGSNGNPPSNVINAASGAVPLLAFSQVGKTDAPVVFTTQSPAFATLFNSAARFIVGYTVYNISPLNHTVDSDAAGASAGSSDFAFRADGYFEFGGVPE